jgi:hypothetical protein
LSGAGFVPYRPLGERDTAWKEALNGTNDLVGELPVNPIVPGRSS